ncbi:MAG: sce7726 family protein [Rikenellaceae bacterium]
MIGDNITYTSKDRSRDYSAIFSRRVFSSIIDNDDFSYINIVANRYDRDLISGGKLNTYLEYIRYLYKHLCKEYRCEYLYKNTIINELLIKQHGTKSTIAINEFRAGDTIVDIALFNGISRAFEIKTEYDSDKRLVSQLSSYCKIFHECYIVIPESLLSKYIDIVENNIGIDLLYRERGLLKIKTYRHATTNVEVDPDIMIKSLRVNEYKNIVEKYFGTLPDVSSFRMYNACLELLRQIDSGELQRLFNDELKLRTTVTPGLNKVVKELRQICLSLNVSLELYKELESKLKTKIII